MSHVVRLQSPVKLLAVRLTSKLLPTLFTLFGPRHCMSQEGEVQSKFLTILRRNYIGDVDITQLPESPNTITTLLWRTKFVPKNKVGSGFFGLGNQIIADNMFNSASCKITYDNLVNAQGVLNLRSNYIAFDFSEFVQGNAVYLQSTASEAYPTTCDSDNYLPYYECTCRIHTVTTN